MEKSLLSFVCDLSLHQGVFQSCQKFLWNMNNCTLWQFQAKNLKKICENHLKWQFLQKFWHTARALTWSGFLNFFGNLDFILKSLDILISQKFLGGGRWRCKTIWETKVNHFRHISQKNGLLKKTLSEFSSIFREMFFFDFGKNREKMAKKMENF